MNLLGQVKDYFGKGKKKKPLTAEQKAKRTKANPFNVKAGISTIKDYNKRQKAQLDKIMNN